MRHIAAMHTHAAALDRIGKQRVLAHYNVTDRSWRNWRAGGVPGMLRNSMIDLAAKNGVQVPELSE